MDNNRQEVLNNKINTDIAEFREQCLTLHLATVDQEGVPNASYAPFIYDNNQYVVLISDMAKHARNLKQVNSASLMLIEDEKTARELFARKRLTMNAIARLVDKETEEGQQLLAKLQQRYGERINELGELGDFNLFVFEPLDGLFVKGFGKAFKLDSEGKIIHLRGGHKNMWLDNQAHQG